ncbi:hypothetical protein PPYR_12309 [Photinus pyralis]|uniref:Uncharacterized protein n=1 Tax=Photinus pyralis TaxID=7054 RepID=A0A5N4ADR4_PHOPY|nr:uncharacterized protein LOC116175483 isoform X2 [Photinus pyralis]KAB0795470.1 hypothetical protein PPYR_12309 [Photinus pyralis]
MPELRRRLRSNAENFVQSDGLYVHSNPPRALQINSAYIKQLIRNGDIEKLQNLVIEGQGKRLIGGYSADYKTRAFLKTVPNTISKINLLHDAVNSGRLEELEALLDEEPDRRRLILAKDDAGVCLLHKAVYYNLTDIIKWIIANYPQAATSKDSEGRTPCHYTPACKEPEAIQKLLTNAGADISAVDNKQRTTQYYMSHASELELPSVHKISKSPRKSTPCNEGVVIKKSNIRIWIHQRDLGNLQKVVWEGHGAKLLVEHSTNHKVKKFLEAVPPILGLIKDIHTDVVNDDLEQLQTHSSSPVPPVILSAKDINGLSPLHKAAGLGYQGIAEYIVENYPLSVNITDNDGRTPLHFATLAKDDGKMFDYLIGAGADESLLDNKQKTAAYYKQRSSEIDSKLLHVIPECPRTAKEGFAPTWDWSALANVEIISKPVRKVIELIKKPSEESHEAEKQTTEVPENENKEVKENGTEKEPPAVPDPEPEPEPDPVPEPEVVVAESIPDVANHLVETVIDDVIANGDINDDVEDANPKEESEPEEDDDGTLHEPITESEDVEVLPADETAPALPEIVPTLSPEIVMDKEEEAPAEIVAEQTRVDTPKPVTPAPPPTPAPRATPAPPVTPAPPAAPALEAKEEMKVVDEGVGVIEGIVNGENEVESVNEQGQGVEDKEDDPEILALIEEGNMEQLAALVLNGDGEKLIGYHSDNPELQAFLDNVPTYMSKINRIHVAAKDGSLRDLQAALDRRKFAIAKDHISPNGTSPLHVATIFGNTSIVRYLAGRFPETVLAVDNNDRTPLHYAAVLDDNNHYFNLLIHLGSNPKAEDKFGHTPEFYRTDREEFSHRILLCEFGAEDVADDIIHDKDKSTNNVQVDMPFFYTEEGRYLASSLGDPLIKGLTEVANKRPDDPIAYLATYLYNFANNNSRGKTQENEEVITGPPEDVDSNNAIPTTIDVVTLEPDAESTGEEESAFNKTSRDEHGQSMLHFAAARSHGRDALFQLLIETEVNISYRDELYRTARDISIQANIPENTNEIDKYVLHIACKGDTDKLVELLLNGYDHITDVVDEDDVPIIEAVSSKEQDETVSFLQSILTFEEKRERVHHAIRQGSIYEVTSLLADENETGSGKLLAIGKNSYGRCTLHIAVLCQQEEIVDYLVNTFPDTLNVGDNLERTALHYSMGIEKMESINKLLVKGGAKRVIKDLKGRQPSYYFMNKSDILRLQEEEETF